MHSTVATAFCASFLLVLATTLSNSQSEEKRYTNAAATFMIEDNSNADTLPSLSGISLSRSSRAVKRRGNTDKSSNPCFTSNIKKVSNETLDNNNLDFRVNQTISYFVNGEEELILSENQNIVVVIGISGSGKSSLLQFLSTDNKNLIGVKNCGEMLIEDGNVRIGSSTKSHTKIPERHVDLDGTIYYDMPGFGDTRNAIYDITTGYFIKKVLDHASHVKIVLVVSYGKVRLGADRSGLKLLFENVVRLIPNIDKFKNSFGLIVSKIDRHINENGHEVDDISIIDNIASFLEVLQNDTITDTDKEKIKSNEAIIKLIDFLNYQDENNNYEFSNIGLFKRPYQTGPLSEDIKLQNSKKSLLNLIKNNLKYIPSNKNDFQFSISADSQLYIKDLTSNIEKYVKNDFNNIFELIKITINSKNESLCNTNAINNIKANLTNLNSAEENITLDMDFVLKLRNSLPIINIHNLDKNFTTMFRYLKFSDILSYYLPKKQEANLNTWKKLYIKNIIEHVNQFLLQEFDQVFNLITKFIGSENKLCELDLSKLISDTTKSSSMIFVINLRSALKIINIDIDNKFITILSYLKFSNILTNLLDKESEVNFETRLQIQIKSLLEKNNNYINLNLDYITDYILSKIELKHKKIFDIFELQKINAKDLIQIRSFLNTLKNENFKSSTEFFSNLNNFFKSLIDIDIIKKFETLSNHLKFVDYMMELFKDESKLNVDAWITKLKKCELFTSNLELWYFFITNLHDSYYAQFNQQQNKNNINFQLINLNCNSEQGNNGMKIAEYFNTLSLDYKNRGENAYTNIINMNKNYEYLLCNQLNSILQFTMYNKPLSIQETETDLILENDFVILSNLESILSKYNSKKNIIIIAYFKIFIDISMRFENSKNVYIFSPQWDIVGRVELQLVGTHGITHNTRARDGTKDTGEYGMDGLHGSSGKPSGNFVGVGKKIVNAEFLTVNCVGGDGGNGQDGGNGANGKPGKHPEKQYFLKHYAYWEPRDNIFCIYDQTLQVHGSASIDNRDDVLTCGRHSKDYGINNVMSSGYRYSWECKIKGSKGGLGGNGGNGGNSGSRGEPGFIYLYFKNDLSKIKVKRTLGKLGQQGKGGNLGLGGIMFEHKAEKRTGDANLMNVVPRGQIVLRIFHYCYYCSFDNFKTLSNPNKNGIKGKPGTLLASLSNNPLNQAEQINYFKSKVYGNLKSIIPNSLLYNFITNELVSNEIEYFFTISDYFTEYKYILQNYDNNNYALYFLQNLLTRIERIQTKIPVPNDKIICEFLINAIILKINSDINTKQQLVINIEVYIKQIEEGILSFKDLQKNKYILSIKNEYQNDINIQTNKAVQLSFIHLQTSIEQYKKQLNVNILSLLNEVENLQEQVVDYKKDLENIEKMLKLEKVLGILKVIASLISSVSSFIPIIKSKPLTQSIKAGADVLRVTMLSTNDLHGKPNNPSNINVPQNIINNTLDILDNNTRNLYKQTLVSEFNKKYKPSTGKLAEVRDKIQKADQNIQNLKEFEKDISSQLKPFLLKISSDLSSIDKELQNSSNIEIIIQNWEMKANLRKIQDIISTITNGLEVDKKFSSMINELQFALEVVYNTYEKIDSLKSQSKSYEFFAKISQSNDPLFQNLDKKSLQIVNDLKYDMESNMIIHQYKELLGVLNQHVFPFADKYTSYNNLKFNNMELNDKTNHAINQIHEIRNKLLIDKSSINTEIDKDIEFNKFYSKYAISSPFYIWKGIDYKTEFDQLLSGNIILLKSDVFFGNSKNALKFNDIDIVMKTYDKSNQKKLDDILNNYTVKISHSGVSYYKCDQKYFVIKSANVSFTFSFLRNPDNVPLLKNLSYKKLGKGDMLLSPYTYWTIRLIDNNLHKYEDLEPFKGKINIELSGYGQYLKDNSNICKTNLAKFYNQYDNYTD